MRVLRPAASRRREDHGAIFVGRVETQRLVDEESPHFFCLEVTFRQGARNRLHTHSTDQILIITAGEGIVADEREQHEVAPGDIALISAGEPHWHGARPGRDMTHLSITAHAKTTIVGDDADPYEPPR